MGETEKQPVIVIFMKSFKEVVNSNGRAFGVPTKHASKLQKLKVLQEKIIKVGNSAKKVLSYPVIAKENDWIIYELWKVPFQVPRVWVLPLNKEELKIAEVFWGSIASFGLLTCGGTYLHDHAPKIGAVVAIPALFLFLGSGAALYSSISMNMDYILEKMMSKYKGGNIE